MRVPESAVETTVVIHNIRIAQKILVERERLFRLFSVRRLIWVRIV